MQFPFFWHLPYILIFSYFSTPDQLARGGERVKISSDGINGW
jgi:hypothetical protein